MSSSASLFFIIRRVAIVYDYRLEVSHSFGSAFRLCGVGKRGCGLVSTANLPANHDTLEVIDQIRRQADTSTIGQRVHTSARNARTRHRCGVPADPYWRNEPTRILGCVISNIIHHLLPSHLRVVLPIS